MNLSTLSIFACVSKRVQKYESFSYFQAFFEKNFHLFRPSLVFSKKGTFWRPVPPERTAKIETLSRSRKTFFALFYPIMPYELLADCGCKSSHFFRSRKFLRQVFLRFF
ncbi:hypothetical protein, partial [Flavobacterium agri]|uniref:hypothetical protein n=1 Tax=Flavobacterium agri TaxID=2743471 RepID=UPI001C378B4A